MTTGAKAPAKSERGCAKGQYQYLEGLDVVGIVMGVPIFVLGLGLALYAIPGSNYFGLVGVVLLFVSIGLSIPGELYEYGITRAIGFAAAVLAAGVSVALAVFAGCMAYWTYQEEDPTFALGAGIFTLLSLAVFGYALGCTIVLLKKLEPETKQTVSAIAAGIVVGLLLVLLMYLLHFFE